MSQRPTLPLLLALCVFGIVHAEGVRKVLEFPKGSASLTISNSVIRGESDCWELSAKAGQTLAVRISAVESNAVFAIFLPGFKESRAYGTLEIEGPSLPGANEGQDARAWKGKLPATGKYLILAGGTRGNASYALTVTLTP